MHGIIPTSRAVEALLLLSLSHSLQVRPEISMPAQELGEEEVYLPVRPSHPFLNSLNQAGSPPAPQVFFPGSLPPLESTIPLLSGESILTSLRLPFIKRFSLLCKECDRDHSGNH
uniref:Putative secreted protein n=1 Tax=Panstrongylus lignarius TaxID=156445 RepID=A0A224Y227_9HEMI